MLPLFPLATIIAEGQVSSGLAGRFSALRGPLAPSKGTALWSLMGLAEVRFRSERKPTSAVNRKPTSAELPFAGQRANAVDGRSGAQASPVYHGDQAFPFQAPKGGTNRPVRNPGAAGKDCLRSLGQPVWLRVAPEDKPGGAPGRRQESVSRGRGPGTRPWRREPSVAFSSPRSRSGRPLAPEAAIYGGRLIFNLRDRIVRSGARSGHPTRVTDPGSRRGDTSGRL